MDKFTNSASEGPAQSQPQNETVEDLLKSQTVGLVNLTDFRKRRAEAVEQKEREAHNGAFSSGRSGATTPSDRSSTPQPAKKRKKAVAKGKLSFGIDDEDEESSTASPAKDSSTDQQPSSDSKLSKARLGPNTSISNAPKVLTKSTLAKEAQTRSQLRKEFTIIQEALKSTEILIPFVFYDGTNIPGGVCRVKKGDHIWFFLDKARKVGAQRGVGGDRSKKEWARVGVDDLMLVRGEIIIPHHHDFYYFIINGVQGFEGPLFDFSAQPSQRTITSVKKNLEDPNSFDPLTTPSQNEKEKNYRESRLEGADHDPSITKVVDRRWYERNKHIYPASMWEEFEPGTDYKKSIRKDTQGNAFFFS